MSTCGMIINIIVTCTWESMFKIVPKQMRFVPKHRDSTYCRLQLWNRTTNHSVNCTKLGARKRAFQWYVINNSIGTNHARRSVSQIGSHVSMHGISHVSWSTSSIGAMLLCTCTCTLWWCKFGTMLITRSTCNVSVYPLVRHLYVLACSVLVTI